MPVKVARKGRLTMILGPMFAGKSTELIRRGLAAREMGEEILVLKPEIDDRYHRERVVSHSGEWLPAIPVSIWPEIPKEISNVLLDEVQFFDKPWFRSNLSAMVTGLLNDGVHVTTSGLHADWRGKQFPVVRTLRTLANEIVFLTARCSLCAKPAHHTAKLGGTLEQVQIGGADLYEPRCAEHWHVSDISTATMNKHPERDSPVYVP